MFFQRQFTTVAELTLIADIGRAGSKSSSPHKACALLLLLVSVAWGDAGFPTSGAGDSSRSGVRIFTHMEGEGRQTANVPAVVHFGLGNGFLSLRVSAYVCIQIAEWLQRWCSSF